MSFNGSAETVNLKTEETQIENKNLDVEEGEVKQTSEEIENVSEEFLKELDERRREAFDKLFEKPKFPSPEWWKVAWEKTKDFVNFFLSKL